MSIVDAQARALIPLVLRTMAETIEDQRLDIPFERSEGSVAMLEAGRSFTDGTTGQKYHALVYVMIAESEEEIEARVSTLLPPGAV